MSAPPTGLPAGFRLGPILLACSLVLFTPPAPPVWASSPAEGWIQLFDGESLFGWKDESGANWRVVDGAVTADEGPTGLLRTTSQFSDFDLTLDFQLASGANSGVFLRTSPRPANPQGDCYEINLAPAEDPFPSGSLVQRLRGSVPDVQPEKWHHLQVSARQHRITVQIDGQQVVSYDGTPWLGRGYIGLQHRKGKVAFRNIFLRPQGLQPLFQERSLVGWNTYPQMAGEFERDHEGDLRVQGGPGQLETQATFADFVLQVTCKTHQPGLNSGIFFRCLPGQTMMGYESQIHNGFLDGDRHRPADWGTGAIFRRQPARRIVADDLVWFHKTLIVVGPHMAAWVNGYQVTDWTDTRPVDENPRRGQRTAAGSIILQAHDSTTDLSFRELRVAELAARRPLP